MAASPIEDTAFGGQVTLIKLEYASDSAQEGSLPMMPQIIVVGMLLQLDFVKLAEDPHEIVDRNPSIQTWPVLHQIVFESL